MGIIQVNEFFNVHAVVAPVNVGRGRINVFENEVDQFNFDFYKHSSDKLFSETESAGWRAFQLAYNS